MVTDTELTNRSHELENSLMSGHLEEYCELKVTNTNDEHEKMLWQFLKVIRTCLLDKCHLLNCNCTIIKYFSLSRRNSVMLLQLVHLKLNLKKFIIQQ